MDGNFDTLKATSTHLAIPTMRDAPCQMPDARSEIRRRFLLRRDMDPISVSRAQDLRWCNEGLVTFTVALSTRGTPGASFACRRSRAYPAPRRQHCSRAIAQVDIASLRLVTMTPSSFLAATAMLGACTRSAAFVGTMGGARKSAWTASARVAQQGEQD